MRKLVQKTLFILAVLSFSISAAENINCHTLSLKSLNNNLLLDANVNQGQLFFIKNTSTQSVWIDHPAKKPMNAGWSSFLTPNHWSALSLANKKSFSLSCSLISPGHVVTLNCAKILSVCAPKAFVFPATMKNRNFWIAENKASFEDILSAVAKRKIIIK